MTLVNNNDKSSINAALSNFKNRYIKDMNNAANIEWYNQNMQRLFAIIEVFSKAMKDHGGHFNYSEMQLLEHSTNLDIVLAKSNELSAIEPCFELLESEFSSWNAELDGIASLIADQVNTVGHAMSGDDGSGDGSFADLISSMQATAQALAAAAPAEVVTSAVEAATEAAGDAAEEAREETAGKDPYSYGVEDDTPDWGPPGEHSGAGSWEDHIAQLMADGQDDYREALEAAAEASAKADAADQAWKDTVGALVDAVTARDEADNEAVSATNAQIGVNTVTTNGNTWVADGTYTTSSPDGDFIITLTTNDDGTHTVTTYDTATGNSTSNTYLGSANDSRTQANDRAEAAYEAQDKADEALAEASKAEADARQEANQASEAAINAEHAAQEIQSASSDAAVEAYSHIEAENDYNSGVGNDYSPQNPPPGAEDDLDGNDISGK